MIRLALIIFFSAMLGLLPATLLAQCGPSTMIEPRACPNETLTLQHQQNPLNKSITWNPTPLSVDANGNASYFFPAIANFDQSYFQTKTVTVIDTVLICTTTVQFDVYRNWHQPLSIVSQSGPWNGDTSLVNEYTFEYIDSNQVYSQIPTWTITGGTLVDSSSSVIYQVSSNPMLMNRRSDTLRIKWDNTGTHAIDLSLSYTMTPATIPNPRTCSATTSLSITPRITGPSRVCIGDTATYTSNVNSATYNWTATGGTIITGANSATCEVQWNNTPGTLVVNTQTTSDTMIVQQHLLPAPVNLGPDTSFCSGDNILLDAGPGYVDYLWNMGAVTQSVVLNQTGSYWVIATDQCGFISSDTINLTEIFPVQPDLGPDTAFCAGNSVVLSAGTAGFNQYFWSTASTAPTITTNFVGTYWLTTVDTNGCQATDSINVGQYSAIPHSITSPAVCDSFALSNASVLPDPGFVSYTWSNSATTLSTMLLAGNHWLATEDTAGCLDTAFFAINSFNHIPVVLGNDTAVCPDTSFVLDAGPNYLTYNWGGLGTSQTFQVNTAGTYPVEVFDINGCSSTDTIVVTSIGDCVFPGDADHDGTANNFDVLTLGIGFGATGPARPGATTQWYGQTCPDWSSTFVNGPNYKHADCNGNGAITQDDTLAILLNYGQTHNKTSQISASGVAVNVTADFDSVMAGDTAVFVVTMADSLAPADSIYGVAFTVNYDTSEVDSQGMLFADFSGCWMSASPQNLLNMVIPLAPVPEVDMAVVRTTGTDTSGYGEVCRMGFVTIDNISGKRQTLAKPLHVWLSDIRLITHENFILETTTQGDSTVVYQDPLSQPEALGASAPVRIFPNPSGATFTVDLPRDVPATIRLYDMQGRTVRQLHSLAAAPEVVDVRQLRNGVYFFEIQTETQVYRQKVIVHR